MTPPIKVLIVDDSAVVRQVLTAMLDQRPRNRRHRRGRRSDLRDGTDERKWPDVVVLDVEMPRMDGITFLKS